MFEFIFFILFSLDIFINIFILCILQANFVNPFDFLIWLFRIQTAFCMDQSLSFQIMICVINIIGWVFGIIDSKWINSMHSIWEQRWKVKLVIFKNLMSHKVQAKVRSENWSFEFLIPKWINVWFLLLELGTSFSKRNWGASYLFLPKLAQQRCATGQMHWMLSSWTTFSGQHSSKHQLQPTVLSIFRCLFPIFTDNSVSY